MMLIVTLCAAAAALLGAADCHVMPPPLETSELLLPPLVEKAGREEEMAVVGGMEDDGRMEREMEAVGADMVEGGEVVDGGRELVEEENEMASCPGGWSLFGQRCFRVESTPRTWAESERQCLIHGANLASVHSVEEYHFIQRMTTSVSWIGGYDATQEHFWFWSDGSRLVYQNWAPGEPDNDKGQHCMTMNRGGGLQWDDNWCTRSSLPSICAKRV